MLSCFFPTDELISNIHSSLLLLPSAFSKKHGVFLFKPASCLLCHSHLPKIYQSFLMSATLSEDVQALKELLLHNPVMSHSWPLHVSHSWQCTQLQSVCFWTWVLSDVCSLPLCQVILKLQGSQLPDSSQLQQYSINCEEEDKFLLIYTLLKLRLVQGKTLVFVGAVERCYRLKLFLEQFGIPACVLNSELPVQSRWGRSADDGVERCLF